MPRSFANVIIHVVFSTKNRMRVLNAPLWYEMHAYMATVVRGMECECYRVGGVEDHAHLAIGLSRTLTIAKMVELIKTSSSKWVKTKGSDLEEFSWQRGYAAFSCSYKERERICAYIDGQEQHHATRTFKEEYLELLKEPDLVFDDQYIWD